MGIPSKKLPNRWVSDFSSSDDYIRIRITSVQYIKNFELSVELQFKAHPRKYRTLKVNHAGSCGL